VSCGGGGVCIVNSCDVHKLEDKEEEEEEEEEDEAGSDTDWNEDEL
jgi:hypothetical protein